MTEKKEQCGCGCIPVKPVEEKPAKEKKGEKASK